MCMYVCMYVCINVFCIGFAGVYAWMYGVGVRWRVFLLSMYCLVVVVGCRLSCLFSLYLISKYDIGRHRRRLMSVGIG